MGRKTNNMKIDSTFVIFHYFLCGIIYTYVIDYIGRKTIKEHTKELTLRPFKFHLIHAILVLTWPIRVLIDLYELLIMRLKK